jgi:hypothetical protein
LDLFRVEMDRDLRDSVSLGLGLMVLSYLVTAIGIFNHVVFLILISVLFIATLHLTIRRIKRVPGRFRAWTAEYSSKADRLLWALLGLIVVADLISAGNAAVGWDAAVHHYAFPEILLRAGHMVRAPEIPFSYYPEMVEMLFTLGLGTGGVFTAGALTWLYLFPLAGGMMVLGRRIGHPSIGLWALVLFLGSPLTFELPFSGVVDLPFLVYCLLALAVLEESDRPARLNGLIVIGILIGCASATKHLGLLYLLAFIPILVWHNSKDSIKPGRLVIDILIVAVLALIIPSFWYLRSYLATGDPLFPFLSGLAERSKATEGSFSLSSFARTDYPRTLIGFLGYLWHLTMDYWDERPWFLAINPAFLAFLPIGIIWAISPPPSPGLKSWTGSIRRILALGILALLINFFLAPAYPRYLFPTWFCLSITGAAALVEIMRLWPKPGRVLVPLALVLPLLIVTGMASRRAVEVMPQYWDKTARMRALEAETPGYDTFLWANEHLDPRSTRIISTDPKIYYLDSPAIIGKPGIESSLLVPWDSEPSKILANWRALGVTHFILDTSLISTKHGFGISLFTDILGDRQKVWLDIVSARFAANAYGIVDILTDEEFMHMSELAELPVIYGIHGTIDRYLLTRERLELFQSWGRDWLMARVVLKLIDAGILREEFRSGPGGGIRIYKVELPPTDDVRLPELPDVTGFGLDFEKGPADRL